MEDSVVFQEVIFAGIARNFEFSTYPNGAVEPFALLYALHDLLVVLLEVEGVVIETAEAYLDMELPKLHSRRKIKSNNNTQFDSSHNLIDYDEFCRYWAGNPNTPHTPFC